METIISLLKYIFIVLIGSTIGSYKERKSKGIAHDKKIFASIEKILTDKDVMHILEEAGPGYIPKGTFSKCDSLNFFVKDPANNFVNKKLNNKFIDFVEYFNKLNSLYAGSPYGGYLNEKNLASSDFKLILTKRGDKEEQELINRNIILAKETTKSIMYFD